MVEERSLKACSSIKTIRTLTKIVKIKFFITLEINQRFTKIRGTFFQGKWLTLIRTMSLSIFTCLIPIPISQIHGSLETSDIRTMVTAEPNSLAAIRADRRGLSAPKSQSPKNCHYLTSWKITVKAPLTGLVFIWSVRKAVSSRHLSNNHWPSLKTAAA